jgi:hypothetical protein
MKIRGSGFDAFSAFHASSIARFPFPLAAGWLVSWRTMPTERSPVISAMKRERHYCVLALPRSLRAPLRSSRGRSWLHSSPLFTWLARTDRTKHQRNLLRFVR